MARPRKLSSTVVPAVRRALAAGVPRKDVMKLFGIGRATLWRALNEGGSQAEGAGSGVLKHLSGVLKHRAPCAVTGPTASIEEADLSNPETLVMGGIFSPSAPSAPPPPPPPPPPPTVEDPSVEEARKKQLDVANKARGRAATLLTGGQGDTSQAPLGKATLLGA